MVFNILLNIDVSKSQDFHNFILFSEGYKIFHLRLGVKKTIKVKIFLKYNFQIK